MTNTKEKAIYAVIILSMLFAMPPLIQADNGSYQTDPAVLKQLQDLASQIGGLQKLVESQNEVIKSQAVEIQGLKTVKEAKPVAEISVQPQKKVEGPAWYETIKQGGDYRLRWEAFSEQKSTGTLEDRNRFRHRLRYGIESGLGNDMKFGFRLVTAGLNSRESSTNPTANTARTVYAGDPTSTNQTLGSPGLFSYQTVALDKAYAKYEPAFAKDKTLGPITLRKVELGGGKFENPHLKYSTPMIWDADVMPEGIYEKMDINLYHHEKNEVNLFGISMQSPLRESVAGDSDVSLFSFQTGLNLVAATPIFEKPVEFTSAFGAYFYNGYSERQSFTFDSGTTSLARGNTTCVGGAAGAGSGDCVGLESGNPRILDFYNELKLNVTKVPITLFNDVATNINNGAVSGESAMKDTGWGLGAKLGQTKNKGDWELSYAYYQIPPNAVVGAFSDSDFGQGHANNLGSVLKAAYQLTKSLQLNFAWISVSPYDPILTSDVDQRTNRFQADLGWKF